MSVQDDQREKELCRIFNIHWDQEHERSGIDGYFKVKVDGVSYEIPVEVKSTTGTTIATARDVGMAHIAKWKKVMWVVGYYSKGGAPKLLKCLCLTPADMLPWIDKIEKKIRPDFEIAALAPRHLTMSDLHAVCGNKSIYTLQDAKSLHKQQWTQQEYIGACDMGTGKNLGFSPEAMLKILQLRAKYIAERGATLNNPHIEKGFLSTFADTNRIIVEEHAIKIREIVTAYIANSKTHPFPVLAGSGGPAAIVAE